MTKDEIIKEMADAMFHYPSKDFSPTVDEYAAIAYGVLESLIGEETISMKCGDINYSSHTKG
jgi:hypothetical protein